ncbi:hypothetical protein GCM10023322_52410 [Rugosimonospora acidiphila]|uniref:DUF4259 domain-containing protein n=1 Tax=Rugosimonospora acidiphila TaxID=556531 RepID=A0ABP9S7Y4_9ACTN
MEMPAELLVLCIKAPRERGVAAHSSARCWRRWGAGIARHGAPHPTRLPCPRQTDPEERTLGSWGPGPFDDDTAMDFVDDVANGPPSNVMPALLDAVDRLTAPQGAQDYGRAARGLAAAALVAGIAPEGATEWAANTIPNLGTDDAAAALQAIHAAYGEDAILPELATDADSRTRHLAALEPARQLLRAAIPPPQHEVLF